MTRIGWVILVGILLVAGVFASVLRFGDPPPRSPRAAVAAVAPPRGDGLPALIVPVAGVSRAQVADSWGDARGEGRGHRGNDIAAPGGTPVLAAADGTVEKLFESRLGGTTLYQRSADGGWTFYYAHLRGYAPGVREGRRVRSGEVLAYVGDTGDAGAGNTHLHFSLTRRTPGQRWWQGEDVNPYPALAGR